MIPRSWWLCGALLVAAAGLLPVAARAWRGPRAPACELDGSPIPDELRVRIVSDDLLSHEFCSLICAELWLEADGRRPREVRVTDEITRRELPADCAHYARSRVISNRVVRENRHVFAEERDAQLHAERFQGRVLLKAQRPFARAIERANE